jgi:hypothetical protein
VEPRASMNYSSPLSGILGGWQPAAYVSTLPPNSHKGADYTNVLVLRISKFQVYWNRIRLTKDQPHSIGKASGLDGFLAEDETTGATQQLWY